MTLSGYARWTLGQESRAMLTRLSRLDYFAAIEPMVAAAAPSQDARLGMERFLHRGRYRMRQMVSDYADKLGRRQTAWDPPEMQRRFAYLRLSFNALLADFDTFADVMTQRSEAPFGVWLAGMDVAAADALNIPDSAIGTPPVVCYLDRGHGAAIRRARTRLATGAENPVAIIRVPRERMVGSGIAASLFHEVGHQAAALIGLIPSLRKVLQARQLQAGHDKLAWVVWERWISEICADFWATARLGAGATTGLFGVLSLPRAFVFRGGLDDPHPFPWMRAVLSCAMGRAVFPQPLWDHIDAVWRSFYPVQGLDADRRALLELLLETMPEFVNLLVNHRPAKLRGKTIAEALRTGERSPVNLTALYRRWQAEPGAMHKAPPSLALAALGHARANGRLSPEGESRQVLSLLRGWALRRSLGVGRPAEPHCSCRHARPLV